MTSNSKKHSGNLSSWIASTANTRQIARPSLPGGWLPKTCWGAGFGAFRHQAIIALEVKTRQATAA
jgi:hypothetical protein